MKTFLITRIYLSQRRPSSLSRPLLLSPMLVETVEAQDDILSEKVSEKSRFDFRSCSISRSRLRVRRRRRRITLQRFFELEMNSKFSTLHVTSGWMLSVSFGILVFVVSICKQYESGRLRLDPLARRKNFARLSNVCREEGWTPVKRCYDYKWDESLSSNTSGQRFVILQIYSTSPNYSRPRTGLQLRDCVGYWIENKIQCTSTRFQSSTCKDGNWYVVP